MFQNPNRIDFIVYIADVMIAVLAIGINVASWAISAALKTEKLYDFTGMIANVSIVAFTLGAGGADGPPARCEASMQARHWTRLSGWHCECTNI